MPLWNLTYEKVEKLKEQNRQKTVELKDLQMKPVEDMWQEDLAAVSQALDLRDQQIAEAENKAKSIKAQKTDVSAGGTAKPKRAAKKRGGEDENDFQPRDVPVVQHAKAQQKTVVVAGGAQAAFARGQEATKAAAARGAQASAAPVWQPKAPEPPAPVRTEPLSLMERLKARGTAGFSSGTFDFFADLPASPPTSPTLPAAPKRAHPQAGANDTPSKIAQPPKKAAVDDAQGKPKAKRKAAKRGAKKALGSDSEDEPMPVAISDDE